MLCNCTECNIKIPRGNPWIFGKDYLFCSSSCRYNFFTANPNLENKPPDPYRIPEQTQPIYMPKVPSLRIISKHNNEEPPKEIPKEVPKEVPKEIPKEVPKEVLEENVEPNISSKREILNYILCNFYRKNSLVSTIQNIF